MSFLKRLFKEDKPERTITEAKDLRVKDIIQLNDSFAMPAHLRGQQFQVTAINSYEYERHVETEWVLTGNHNDEIYLSLDVDDKVYLKFSLKLERDDVETLFDLDAFAEIFDEPGNAFLERQADSSLTDGWTDEQYSQSDFAIVGYFHRKDHRSEQLSQYEGKDSGEQFELYRLLNKDESKGIELEVWEDGETDVFVTMYRPTTDIVDMFPGS